MRRRLLINAFVSVSTIVLNIVPVAMIYNVSMATIALALIVHELLHICAARIKRCPYRNGIGAGPCTVFVLVKGDPFVVIFPLLVGIVGMGILALFADNFCIQWVGVCHHGVCAQYCIEYAREYIGLSMFFTIIAIGSIGDLWIFYQIKRGRKDIIGKFEKLITRYAIFLDFEAKRILVGEEIYRLSRRIDAS